MQTNLTQTNYTKTTVTYFNNKKVSENISNHSFVGNMCDLINYIDKSIKEKLHHNIIFHSSNLYKYESTLNNKNIYVLYKKI